VDIGLIVIHASEYHASANQSQATQIVCSPLNYSTTASDTLVSPIGLDGLVESCANGHEAMRVAIAR
jgi:hypothetical protein